MRPGRRRPLMAQDGRSRTGYEVDAQPGEPWPPVDSLPQAP